MPPLHIPMLVDEPSKRTEEALHKAMPNIDVHAINFNDLMRVMFKAYDVFEDTSKAERWFRKRNRALRNKTPLEVVLNEKAGSVEVEQVLGRIEHGVFS